MAQITFDDELPETNPYGGVPLSGGGSPNKLGQPANAEPYTNWNAERAWAMPAFQKHVESKPFLYGKVGSDDYERAFKIFNDLRPTLPNRGDAFNRTLDELGWWTGQVTAAPKTATPSGSGRTGTGNARQDWERLIAGLPPTTASIAQVFPQFLEMYPGSSFDRGDIKGPWGSADVIGNLSSGNGKWQWYVPKPGGGSITAGAGGQYTDPHTQLYEKMVLDRIDQLLNSVNRPDDDRYRSAALARVDDLTQNPPYTAAEEQALITRMREPLTQARDTRQDFMKEIMGGRNIGPSSGLFLDQVYNTPERDYERALAGGTNDLAVRAIDEKQSRKNEALDILANLVGLGRDARTETDNRSREAVTTGAILPGLDERRLQLLMQTLGMGGTDTSATTSALLSLMGMNQNQSQFNAGQSANNAAQWGNILGYLVNSPLFR